MGNKTNVRVLMTLVFLGAMVLFGYQNCASKLNKSKITANNNRSTVQDLSSEDLDTIRAELREEVQEELRLQGVPATVEEYNNAVADILAQTYQSLTDQGIPITTTDLSTFSEEVRSALQAKIDQEELLAQIANQEARQAAEVYRKKMRHDQSFSNTLSNSCRIENGGLKCWGYRYYSIMSLPGGGDSTLSSHTSGYDYSQVGFVTGMGEGSGVTAVEIAHSHHGSYHRPSVCAIKNGDLFCWGYNGYGQLGVGNTNWRNAPNLDSRTLPNSVHHGGYPNAKVIKVSGSYHSFCAIVHVPEKNHQAGQGDLFCWGRTGYGKTGTGHSSQDGVVNMPQAVMTSGFVTDVSVGTWSTCAISNGEMFCFGYNNYGQLAKGDNANIAAPPASPSLPNSEFSNVKVEKVSMGGSHGCALADGEVYCWGYNTQGQLGDNSNTHRNKPVKVIGLPDEATDIVAGGEHSCALTIEGAVYCWGHNGQSQLGPINGAQDTAVPMAYASSDVEAIYGHGYHTQSVCMKLSNGKNKCWGRSWYRSIWAHNDRAYATPVDPEDY